MIKCAVALASLFACLLPQAAFAQTYWVTGFWSAGNVRESIANIPWSNISHLCYFAAGINSSGSVVPAYTSQPELANIVSAAHANGVKIVIVLSDGTGNSFEPAAGPSLVSTTAANIASYVNTNNFDGVDFDWESSVNVADYESLISRTRSALPAGKLIIADVYNAGGNMEPVMANQYSNLDQINAMCYDMDISSGYTWHNDALLQNGDTSKNTCDWRVRAFTNAGVPASKMGVGMPFYGRHWTGSSLPLQTGGSQVGTSYYADLVNGGLMISTNMKWDATYSAEYLSFPGTNQFYSYNGVRFIDAMVPWAKSKGYGGFMLFTLEYEYISSASGAARYPLSTELHTQVFGGSSSAPTISSFTASPSTITAGSPSTLSWSTSGATSLSINQGVGTVTGNSVAVNPAATTTYTLTATNSAGSVTRSVTVTVTVANSPPTISSFTANPAMTGPGESTMLSWATASATSLSIDQGVGVVTNTTSKAVSPPATMTYTLTANNASGSVTRPVTVTVSSAPAAYWKFDAGSGTIAADSSGNGHTMTLFNAPGWLTASSCTVNGCLAFNGTNEYGSSALDLSGTNVITLAFWMKWTAYANDNRSALEFTPNFNNALTGFLIVPDESVSGQFQAGVRGNAGYNQVNFPRPSAGVWHHYAFVMNKGASAATQVVPYVDGQAISYTKPTAAANTNNFGKDSVFAMSRAGTSQFGSGNLDEVRIYPRALSASEILSLATALYPPKITVVSPLATGTVGLPYSQTLTSSGSTPITWSVTSGTLPAGLSLSSSSGVISGTPSAAASYSLIVGATNTEGSDSRQFSLTINPSSSTLNYNLSDLKWTSASIGWGTIHLNASVMGNVLTLDGASYTEGVGTHANSQIVYNINGVCNTFRSSVGVDDEVGSSGSVAFQVFGDSVKLYDSKLLTGSSATQNISISVAGFQQLRLFVNDGGDGINFDHADWANPRLTCSSAPSAAN